LELTDRKVVHFEMGTMITVVCARAYPPFETWTISSAGHPPPVLAAPGRSTVLADVPPDPPLGARPGCLRTETTVLLPPGGLLLLYTDGLVERRDEVIDVGLGRLRSVVAAGHPEAVCGTVMHELVGSGRPMDDIALLAVRRDEGEADASAPRTCEFEPEATAPRAARRFAREAPGPLSEADQQTLELLVSELVSNAVIHAVTPVELTVTRSEVAIRVEVSDRSAAEVRLQPARPTATHGRGLLIVSALADTWGVRNRNSPPGKTVWCTLAINGTPLPDRPDGPWPEVAA
jgi:anti-sigma regulatory factor (Ser/Thr protein kinase)